MRPIEKFATVSGNTYRLRHPWPGTWYWQVVNAAAATEVYKFVVEPPLRRNLAVSQPQMGAVLSGNGGFFLSTNLPAILALKYSWKFC